MSKLLHRSGALFLLLTLIMVSFALPSGQPAHAQSDEVLARIDQAMSHLSGFMGRTITRQSHFWEWSEQVWNNEAMDCPVADRAYPDALTRGYRVQITVDDVQYDYRIKSDGSILLLCIGGQPDPSSVGVEVPVPAPTQVTPLAAASDWAWFYDAEQDVLLLMNPNGVQAQLPRPKLTNELIGDNQIIQLGISRDSRFLIIAALNASQRSVVGIYSLENANFLKVHEGQDDEVAHMETYGSNSALMFNAANSEAAVGFSKDSFEAPTSNTWRVIRFSLADGNAIGQIDNTFPGLAAAGAPSGVDEGFFFPRVIYFNDNNGGEINFQLVLNYSGGSATYPTVTWNPSTNTVAASPYYVSSLDISVLSDQMVFPTNNPGFASLPPNGPFTSHNSIARGFPEGFPPDATTVDVDQTVYHFSSRFAAGERLIIWQTSMEAENTTAWVVLDTTTNNRTILSGDIFDVRGTPNGFWTLTRTGTIAFHTVDNPAFGNPIYQGGSRMQGIWTQLPNTSFGLTQIVTSNPGANVGASLCPGAPPSIIANGIRARVTLSDTDPLPLRMRTSPGGDFVKSIPEGTEFSIIGGPQCNSQFTWWQIRLADGSTGWSAEGDSSNYFMEPLP